MAEQQPIFSLKAPVMESAKALTMVSKVTIIIILPSYIIKGILDFQRVHLWSMREFFRWGLIGPPMGQRRDLQLFSILIPLGFAGSSLVVPYGVPI